MPKGSVRNPGTKATSTSLGRIWTKAGNETRRQSKNIDAALDKMDAREARKKLMKKPGAGRAALMPIKKTIRPATSAKKGSK